MHCDALKQTSVNLHNTENALEENENQKENDEKVRAVNESSMHSQSFVYTSNTNCILVRFV
jgi:hypothetical protein